MKQILFAAFAAVAVLMSACSKDNGGDEQDPTSPITGLELPTSSAEHPAVAGSTVNIKGVGFTASDEIWFSTAVRSSNNVKAEGVALTATGISFTAPAINGETGVVLKQSGKEYSLGNMYFSTGDEPLTTEHIYAIKKTDNGCEIGEYNLADDTFKSTFKLKAHTYIMGVVGDNRSNIYYVAYNEQGDNYDIYVARYNLKEKKEVRMVELKQDYASIGIIDNKLHCMLYDATNGYRLVSVADDGKQTLVKAFGQLPDKNYVFFEDEDVRFVYDATSKSVLLSGETEYNEGENITSSYLSFSLETGVITTKHHTDTDNPNPNIATSTWFNVAKTNAGVLLFTITNTWSTTVEYDDTEVGETVITYIDPITLTKKSDVATIDCEFDRPLYVASKNMLMGIDMDSYKYNIAWSYDLTDKSLKKINSTEDFEYLFTMNY